MFTNFAPLPLSAAIGGFAAAHGGPGPVIIAGSGILRFAMLIGYSSRDLRDMLYLRRLHRVRRQDHGSSRDQETGPPLLP